MKSLFDFWFRLSLLRALPQDYPASGSALGVALTAYFSVSVLLLAAPYGMHDALALATLDTAMLAVFVFVLLRLRGYPARFLQALNGLAGAGSVIGLCSVPLVLLHSPGQTSVLLVLYWLALRIWVLAVSAHVLRHALSVSLVIGVAAALLYTVLSMQIIALLFPHLL